MQHEFYVISRNHLWLHIRLPVHIITLKHPIEVTHKKEDLTKLLREKRVPYEVYRRELALYVLYAQGLEGVFDLEMISLKGVFAD
jgi:hypothetical protein